MLLQLLLLDARVHDDSDSERGARRMCALTIWTTRGARTIRRQDRRSQFEESLLVVTEGLVGIALARPCAVTPAERGKRERGVRGSSQV